MTDTNTEIAADTDDLNAFEQLMYGHTKPDIEDAEATVVENEETEELAEEEVEPEHTPAETDEQEEADNDEDEQPKPKKSRFQERIDQLTEKARAAEREKDDLLQKLNETLAKLEGKTDEVKPAETPKDAAPQPDEADENGEPKYPLGEFDPAYIRDLTRYTIRAEAEAQKEEAARQAAEEAKNLEKAQLAQEWSEKVQSSQERYPDYQEKVADLAEVVQDIDPVYGDFLAETIMTMENGTDVFYHLASNPKIAEDIVNSSPQAALRKLYQIEARFSTFEEEKKEKKLKVSNAPQPPEQLNRGNSPAKDIAPDTDDLEAFEKAFFKKRRF
jgi:DNA repair exonuclease SbcCD ATPase subunit